MLGKAFACYGAGHYGSQTPLLVWPGFLKLPYLTCSSDIQTRYPTSPLIICFSLPSHLVFPKRNLVSAPDVAFCRIGPAQRRALRQFSISPRSFDFSFFHEEHFFPTAFLAAVRGSGEHSNEGYWGCECGSCILIDAQGTTNAPSHTMQSHFLKNSSPKNPDDLVQLRGASEISKSSP